MRGKNKFFIILVLLFGLFSCSESIDDKSLALKKLDNFEVNIPVSWKVVNLGDTTMLPTPSYGKISFIASSVEAKDGFSNNLLILEDKLNNDITSKDFSTFTNLGARNDYESYKDIESKDFTFKDKEDSKLFIFEARYSENTPNLRFMQVAHICEKKSYLLTIALSSNITDSSKYEDILKTFKCRTEIDKKKELEEKKK